MFRRPTMAWYNFDTEDYQYGNMPTTDEDALPLIPPGPRRGLFQVYRQKGMSIGEAMIMALDDDARQKAKEGTA